jgi:hypothetical protein
MSMVRFAEVGLDRVGVGVDEHPAELGTDTEAAEFAPGLGFEGA